MKALIVCSTQRTGSTALATTLAASKVTRNTYEWFEPIVFATTISSLPGFASFKQLPRDLMELSDYTQKILEHEESSNLPVSVMIHKYSHDYLISLGVESLAELFEDPRYVHCYRGSVYRQAVSLSIAEQTQQWIGAHQKARKAKFDLQRITETVTSIQRDNLAWHQHFQEYGIQPFYACYEDYLMDKEAFFHRLVAWLGLKKKRFKDTGLKKQANEVNERFLDRLFYELGTSARGQPQTIASRLFSWGGR